jgi:hypothetical protein
MLNSSVALSSLATLKSTLILVSEQPLLAVSGLSNLYISPDLNDRFWEKQTFDQIRWGRPWSYPYQYCPPIRSSNYEFRKCTINRIIQSETRRTE